jgi:hypothetical protein
VHAVARRAVGDRLRARAGREPVIAVLEGGDLIARQVVLGGQPLVRVAARAGHAGHAGGVHERVLLAGGQDGVLAVAVGADGRSALPSGHRLAVDAVRVDLRDLLVADPAGRRDVPVVDLRVRAARGRNGVRAVAVGAGGRAALARRDGAPVHAARVGLHRPRERDAVPRQELGIGVTARARGRQVLLRHRRRRVGRRQHAVAVPVAGGAAGERRDGPSAARAPTARGPGPRRRGTTRSSRPAPAPGGGSRRSLRGTRRSRGRRGRSPSGATDPRRRCVPWRPRGPCRRGSRGSRPRKAGLPPGAMRA